MPTMVGALDTAVSATIAATGVGTAQIAPPGNERWRITRISVSTNQSAALTTIPTCKVYTSSVADANLFDGTFTGTLDSTDAELWLEKGMPLIAQWTGGVAGTIGSMSIFGERYSY